MFSSQNSIFLLKLNIDYLFFYIGATGVAMVEIDAETILEMEVVLVPIGVIIMEVVLVHTESFDIECFMYYELWAEGFIISVGWFLELEAKR